MVKAIVYVRGGNIQDVISDCEGVEVMIVDYDNEQAPNIRARSFDRVRLDPDHFMRTVACTED